MLFVYPTCATPKKETEPQMVTVDTSAVEAARAKYFALNRRRAGLLAAFTRATNAGSPKAVAAGEKLAAIYPALQEAFEALARAKSAERASVKAQQEAQRLAAARKYLPNVNEASVGELVNPDSLPEAVRSAGGGWVGLRYVTDGCHKDGDVGFKLTEIRGVRPSWHTGDL